MGMAASQARFLGLTARKSNVEFQGQQINQQRTALATESSNLYNQMMTLDVPTPPVTTDYYKTTYTLDDSAIGNKSNYSIENVAKLYAGTDRYTVKLKTSEKNTVSASNTFLFTQVTRSENKDAQEAGLGTYSYVTNLNGSYVTYNEDGSNVAYETDSNTGNNVLKIASNVIYKIDDATASLLADEDEGYAACLAALQTSGEDVSELYFYQDSSKKNCYLTKDQLERITSGAFVEGEDSYSTVKGDVATIDAATYVTLTYPTSKTTDYYYQVNGTLESSSSGRYSSIMIDTNENYPSDLSGQTFSISCVQEYDEAAYTDAYNDYEYEKSMYEQAIANINAKTEIIQAEDKQLEMRLQQLDTEQDAIAKEMDSVTQVIQDNIDKTFDAFA